MENDDMAFDISRLTSAVNRHLNSISDLSSQIRQASEEAAARAQFSVDLKNAIEQNIQSHMPSEGAFPDYGKEIQEAAGQIKDSFTGVSSVASSASGANSVASGVASAENKLVASASQESFRLAEKAGTSAGSTIQASANRDAYTGRLSLEALQELSKSQYFNVNLIQKSLFESSDKTDGDTASSSPNNSQAAAFRSDLSLADLNENSLLAAELLKSGLSGNIIEGFNL